MWQTAAAQSSPRCLSKIKQRLVSRPSSSSQPVLRSTRARTHRYATTSSSHPNCSLPREFNKEQIAVIGEQTAQYGGGSVIIAVPVQRRERKGIGQFN